MKFILVFILVFSPLLGFSQDEVGPEMNTSAEDEVAVEELQRARDERQKTVGAIVQVTETTEKLFNPTEELKKIGHNQLNAFSLMNKEAILIMERAFKEAKMHEMPAELIRENILASFKGHALEGFFRSSPRLIDFFVEVLKDEKAMISALQIFKDKPRMKIYFYLWIVIMFCSYFLRKLFISKFWSRGIRALASLTFSLTISVITLSSFCLVFETEMKPLIRIIKRYI